MITAYRIVKKKWVNTAFDGEGARLYGGRWNSKGQSCVYLAGSESLAILEILVHLDNSSVLDHYTLFSVNIDDADVMTLDNGSLPGYWREDPAPAETAEIGDDWLMSNLSAVLSVPSTIVTRESIYLLNIMHPRFSAIMKTMTELDFEMDNRLL